MDRHRTEVIGYVDRLSAAAGETVACHVSAPATPVKADVVRLLSGDENPAGPGFRVAPVPGFAAEFAGRRQSVGPGSFALSEPNLDLAGRPGATFGVWFWPTRPGAGRQGLAALASASGEQGLALVIEPDGRLAVLARRGEGAEVIAVAGPAVAERGWHFAAVSIDFSTGAVQLVATPVAGLYVRPAAATAAGHAAGLDSATFARFLAGAAGCTAAGTTFHAEAPYDGKLVRPFLVAAVVPADRLLAIAQDDAQLPATELDWCFEQAIAARNVTDASGNGHAGALVNAPQLGMTSHKWTGEFHHFNAAPTHYGAAHFHTDDMEDAGWHSDFSFTVPAGCPSGVYAFRLTTAEAVEYVPFAVRPTKGVATGNRVVMILPTFTYLAYANERMLDMQSYDGQTERAVVEDPQDHASKAHPEFGRSIYDVHLDGSGIAHSSVLRPILNMRPNYRMWMNGGPRHLSADLYIVDWLAHDGIGLDIITDHDLHADGVDLLANYDLVLTSTHPEYVSSEIVTAITGYLDQGGHLMYLGGNGFYWVATPYADRPHLLEVRRGICGTRTWESQPGELHHASTGTLGGLWRLTGRAPNALVGIGFSGQGWARGTGYRRRPDAELGDAAFVFAGIPEDEIIGDFGLVLDGASGDEIDCWDPALGSAKDAVILASSTGHPAQYQPCIEDVLEIRPGLDGTQNPRIRSDMVLLNTAGGGQVFSVGSISFCGSIAYNAYDNNVYRLVVNVRDRFLAAATAG